MIIISKLKSVNIFNNFYNERQASKTPAKHHRKPMFIKHIYCFICTYYIWDFGKYQFIQFSFHILAAVTAGVHMLSMVIVAAVPEHRCEILGIDNGTAANTRQNHINLSLYIPQTQDGTYHSCLRLLNATGNASTTCNSWVFNTTYHQSSRAIEWNFVCKRRWMAALTQTVFMLGVLTGAIIFGRLSDKYGRKVIFCLSAFMQLIFGVLVAFSPNYGAFLVLHFVYAAFGSAGSYITGFVLTMELVGASRRSICGVAFQGAFAVGIMLVAGWGAIIADHQLLQVIYGLHGCLLVPSYWLMDESPRWLWAQGRRTEAVAILKRALHLNRNSAPVDTDFTKLVTTKATCKAMAVKRRSTSVGISDLFKTSNLRRKTLNVCLAWFSNSLVYYGLSLNTGKLNGNPYVILFLMGLIEIPSYVISAYLMDRWGRRILIVGNMIAGGLCCILATVFSAESVVTISFVMAGKFLIASSFAIVYNYSAELFPTVVRNSALGLGSMCARFSSALTPLITLLDSFDAALPSRIFAVMAIISGVLITFLPETLNNAMPQTIEDGELFGIGENCYSNCYGKKFTKTTRNSASNELQ